MLMPESSCRFQPGRYWGARVSVANKGMNIPLHRKVTLGSDYHHDESYFPIEWRIINPSTVRRELTLIVDPWRMYRICMLLVLSPLGKTPFTAKKC